jgi:hypothetical protein
VSRGPREVSDSLQFRDHVALRAVPTCRTDKCQEISACHFHCDSYLCEKGLLFGAILHIFV